MSLDLKDFFVSKSGTYLSQMPAPGEQPRSQQGEPGRGCLLCLNRSATAMLQDPSTATAAPMFIIHSLTGEATSFVSLAKRLGPRPCYGLQVTMTSALGSVEEMALEYLDAIK